MKNFSGHLFLKWIPLAAVILFLWETPIGYPTTLLSTFFHEMSHAGTAWIVGNEVHGVEINPDATGCTWAERQPGFFGWLKALVITSSGYVGSVVLGGLLLIAATRFKWKRSLSVGLAAMILLLSIYFKVAVGFSWLFCGLAIVVLAISGFKANSKVNCWILQILGYSSCLYALADMKKGFLNTQVNMVDAIAMSKLTYIPTEVWEFLWVGISLFVTYKCIRWASVEPEEDEQRPTISAAPRPTT